MFKIDINIIVDLKYMTLEMGWKGRECSIQWVGLLNLRISRKLAYLCISAKIYCSAYQNCKREYIMRKHTSEKPFKCNQCNYACTSSGNLQEHMRKHTGEKPFKCNRCDKSFKHKKSLTSHSQTHLTSD